MIKSLFSSLRPNTRESISRMKSEHDHSGFKFICIVTGDNNPDFLVQWLTGECPEQTIVTSKARRLQVEV